jgi:hypothetical protein
VNSDETIGLLSNWSYCENIKLSSPIDTSILNWLESLQSESIGLSVGKPIVATQDRIIPYYAPNSSIKHNKSDSKDRSQEILWSVKQV